MSDQPSQLRAVGDDPSPDDLLRLVGTGRQDAFGALYDLISPRVFGVALRVVRDRALAEEVAQEALVEVWRKAPRFDPRRGSAMGWITTIAHRRAVDRVRSEQASRDRVARTALPPTEVPDIAEDVVRQAQRQEVVSALGALSEVQREAVELAYFGGNTYRRVAEMLDVPLGTVKTRLRDGLLRLREMLETP